MLQYFYTRINNNQMQRELFNNMLQEFIKCFRPLKRAAMMLMAHGGNEFDTAGL